MSIIFTLLALLWPSDEAVENLRRSAPRDLTAETARAHMTAAQVAAVLYELEPSLLLAIAYRESRYQTGVTGPLVRGKRACGLMQPMMHDTKCQQQTVLEGYLEGASHLRRWLDTKTCRGDLRCAMLGYGGGYALLKRCADGPVMVERSGRTADLCHMPDWTFARARRIEGVGIGRATTKTSS